MYSYLENILDYINTEDEALLTLIISFLNSLFSKVSKETHFLFVSLIRSSIEKLSMRKLPGNKFVLAQQSISLFNTDKGIQSFIIVVMNSIMYGSQSVWADAAAVLNYLCKLAPLEALKKEVIKISGALIWVVNDKFDLVVKSEIFKTLESL